MADTKISALTSASTPLAGTEVVPIVQSSTTKKVAVSDLTAGRTVNALNIGVGTSTFTPNASIAIRDNSGGSQLRIRGTDSTARLSRIQFEDYNGTLADGFVDFKIPTAGSASSAILQLGVNSAAFTLDSSANAKIESGNLVIGTAGKGIDFSATSHAAGMTSELLNDYEEGTFTPTLSGSTGNPTGVAYGTQSGTYTKIGRMVSVYVQLTFTTYTGGSGNAQISGLPFTVGTNGRGPVNLYNATYTGYIVAGGSGTNIILFQNASGAGYTFVPLTGVPSSGTSKFIEVSLVYYV